MRRLLLWVSVLILTILPLSGKLAAQTKPTAQPGNDPRTRRAMRERAVARLDTPSARAFVEAPFGDEAVGAIGACSLPVARKLADFHASGELDKLSRPDDLLRTIATKPGGGDDVAIYAMEHINELRDADALDAFLTSPLDIALGLKSLGSATADARGRRLYAQQAASPQPFAPPDYLHDGRLAVLVIAGGIIIALLIWRKRNTAASG